jgi:hypothetical protein
MAVGAFTDRGAPPSEERIAASLAAAWPAWQRLTDRLEGVWQASGEPRYYGTNYGWARRYRSRGRALASLYPGRGCFTVQIVLPEDAVAGLPMERLSEVTRRAVRTATPYREGRWVFVPVATRADLDEVELLLRAKRPLPDPTARRGRTDGSR